MGAQGSSSGGQGQTGHLKTEFWRGAGVASDHVILSLPAVSGSQCQGNCTATVFTQFYPIASRDYLGVPTI